MDSLSTKESVDGYKQCQREDIRSQLAHLRQLMTTPLTSTNEDIPNGQLMQLALEVMSQAIGSRQDDDQSRELTSEHKDLALPPVCAL